MNFSQFSFRRRVFVKRVASVSLITLAVSLSACSSVGLPFSENTTKTYDQRAASTSPIPSEPVYGYPDRARGKAVSNRDVVSTTPVERTSLAPVQTASNEQGNYLGNSFSLQPLDAHQDNKNNAPRKRYAQAAGGYYDRSASDYAPSYSDYPSYRDRGYADRRRSSEANAYEEPKPYRLRRDEGTASYRSSSEHHTVVEGDTLYGIAKRYGLTTVELAELNGITGSTIYAGQTLKLRKEPKYTTTIGDEDRRPYRRSESRRDYERSDYETSYDRDERKAPSYDSGRGSYEAPRRDDDRYDRYRRERRDYARNYDEAKPDRPSVHRYHKPRGSFDRYSVERGDTLYDIARRYGLNHRELAAYNDIPTSATLYPGQILRIPKSREFSRGHGRDLPKSDAYRRPPPRRDYSDGDYRSPRPHARKRDDDKRRVARAEADPREDRQQTANDAMLPRQEVRQSQPILAAHQDVEAKPQPKRVAEKSTGKCENLLANPAPRSGKTFRVPVQGLIISKFGSKDDGSFNDGVDFSVPKGTPVKAAENGVVAYVGNELSGFGNLILVRHADGYVTAYAHNDRVLVGRCDIIKRGQIIAKAGATGNISRPKLHFELRKNSKAINPEDHFSRS